MGELLMHVIREQPDDDLARLACADWLEEQGRSDRAELIRVQIEVDRLPRHDPGAAPLLLRAGELLAEHESAWLGEWSERLVRWTFRRGFVDSVVMLPEMFLSHGRELFDQHPVREVQFLTDSGAPAGPDVVEELASAPAFERVRSLDASGAIPCSGPAWCRALARRPHLKRLQELHFSSNWRSGAVFDDPEALAELCRADHLAGLKSLSLAAPMAEQALGDEAVEHITGSVFAGSLTSLNLGGLRLTDAAARSLASCRALANLRTLELGWCELHSPEGIQALLDSPHLCSLEELSLGGDIDVTALARSGRLAGLRELTLNTNTNQHFRTFPASAWAELARSPHVARLRRLHLLYALLDEEGAAGLFRTPGPLRLHALMIMGMRGSGDVLTGLLSTSAALAELTSLELPGCNISVAGLRQLLSGPFIARLNLFCVAGNTVQSRGMGAILSSPLARGRLTELHLHHCRLQPGTLRKLMAWRGLVNVTKLELGNNTLDVTAMNALLRSPHAQRLTTLHLGSGHVQPEALRALAHSTQLPRLRDVTLPADTDEATLTALRRRFGPRLSRDPA
jgi:uncharacterized protein (TIGR02996 family)